MPLRIVTDSTADFEADEARDLGIEVAPLTVLFGDEALLDRVEITPEQFYQRLVESRLTPKTSQPSVGRYTAAFERLAAEGATEILAVCLSSRLSGTYGAARLAAATPPRGVRVEAFDSLLVAGGLNALARRAAEMARAGATLDQVLLAMAAMIPRVQIHILLDTLEYLQRGGRIGRARALIGGVLSIKPIIAVEAGEVGNSERVRSRPRGLDRIFEHIVEQTDLERVIVQHTGALEDAQRLVERTKAALPRAAVELRWIGPAVGVYTGPRGVGAVTVQRLP